MELGGVKIQFDNSPNRMIIAKGGAEQQRINAFDSVCFVTYQDGIAGHESCCTRDTNLDSPFFGPVHEDS
jgi:hypothetical protein